MSDRVRWMATHEEAAGVFRIGRDEDDYVAQWSDLAELRAKAGGASPRLTFAPHCPEAVRRKIEGGSAMLLLRQLQGEIALHGAAVAKDGRALLLLGASGAGKSTLAHALVAEDGFELLADDALALVQTADGWDVLPTESLVWLESDMPGVKLGAPARAVAYARAKADRVVSLAFAEAAPVTLAPLPPMACARAWVQSFVRFALDDRRLLELEATRIGELSQRLPCAELRRPRDLSRLPAARAVLTAAHRA